MNIHLDMSTMTSQTQVSLAHDTRSAARWATAIEILLIYAGILLYIWRWQFTYPRLWMGLLGAVLVSHVVHRETPHDLGLTWRGLRGSARIVLPLAVALYVPALLYGFATHSLTLVAPSQRTLVSFVGYMLWCLFQQYLTQSYFHVRLMSFLANRHFRSLAIGLLFGGAHLPNPILTVATAVGGLILAEVFARHRNIWPLALAQAAGGFLIAVLSPPSLIHNMRVGPGYYFCEFQ
ncbi:MAG: CPBP family intramembrane metalloprotease [Acidobacteria bacterium]|nr:CPBP family intramembrane metalloprotease [Acidobacteriota bacterium]